MQSAKRGDIPAFGCAVVSGNGTFNNACHWYMGFAAEYGHLHMLEWAFGEGWRPVTEALPNVAVSRWPIEGIEWYYSHGQ